MEKPFKGKVTLSKNVLNTSLIIPAHKNWTVIIFLAFWIIGWTLASVFSIYNLYLNESWIVITFWLISWITGIFFAIKALIWHLLGEEIISFEKDKICIKYKGALLVKPKCYDLKYVKNLRVKEDSYYNSNGWRSTVFNFNFGTFRFDYGLETIKFGNFVSEAEANFIMDKLVSKGIYNDTKFLK